MSIEVSDPILAGVGARMVSRPADPRLQWHLDARPEQRVPDGVWRVLYFQGGRGSGKTRSGAQGLAEWVLSDTDGEGEYGIIAPTYADAWTKCVEGEAGILKALGTSMAEVKDHRSATVRNAWRTYGQVVLHNGIVIYIDSANEGGLRIQGRNLKGAWADEIGLWSKWEVAWDESLKYALRQGISKVIATGTPKVSRPAAKLIRRILRGEEPGGAVVRRLRTVDNRDNLSEEFYRAVVGSAAGTRLERQELEGELLDDVANALWTRELLARTEHPGLGEPGGPQYLSKVYIGVDPSDGSETSDEQAYTVAGTSEADDPHIYVTESWGGQESPIPFAERVIRKALELEETGADVTLVIEKNHGGGWLKATFQQVMKTMGVTVKYRMIHASQAKRVRAEPVAAMYERHGGMVKHAGGPFVELEDQQATFTGAQGERSPDRLDSLVWALSPFLAVTTGKVTRGGRRAWAAEKELELVGGRPPTRAGRRLAEAHGGAYAPEEGWDLESFGPQEDTERPQTGVRNNRREWR